MAAMHHGDVADIVVKNEHGSSSVVLLLNFFESRKKPGADDIVFSTVEWMEVVGQDSQISPGLGEVEALHRRQGRRSGNRLMKVDDGRQK